MPPEFRLTPDDAWVLLREEVFGRLSVRDLPADERAALFSAFCRATASPAAAFTMRTSPKSPGPAGAQVIVTDNRRHFLAAPSASGIKVETPAEFLAEHQTQTSPKSDSRPRRPRKEADHMPLLFSDGTLQQENVQRATFGRLLGGQRDELTGS